MTLSRPKRCALDNTVLSTLHRARALARVLRLWPGRWLLPLDVRQEASRWRGECGTVLAIVDALRAEGLLEQDSINPASEGALYAELQRTLGRGEAAAIAIVFHRRLTVALDDRQGQRRCAALVPPVSWYSTEGLLVEAVSDGMLTRVEAQGIWAATGIQDPTRGIT